MKIPPTPPDAWVIFRESMKKENKGPEILGLSGPTDHKGRYLHWEKVQYLTPPEGYTVEELWASMKLARGSLYKILPLRDKKNTPFQYSTPDGVLKILHWIDQNASGNIISESPITNPHTRDTYLISSLIDEAISSSQLEGASTTRHVAKEMLRQGRPPATVDEQMIYNNYLAMQFIRDNKDDDLTPAMVMEIHRIVTEGTLGNPEASGQFRTKDDKVHVVDATGSNILHTPPSAEELDGRLNAICSFANEEEHKYFLHPVIKAVLLHFMLAYDHPFVDGNGRTARALFYWSMARQSYWIMEYLSISTIIKKAPVKYGKAYLHTETDGNDTTYFILHQLDVIVEAINELKIYLAKKTREISETEKLLGKTGRLQGELNYRQLHLLRHALKHPNASYKIQQHQKFHATTYQTARTDLLKMSDELGLLIKKKIGKSFVFFSPVDLNQRIEREGSVDL